MGPMRTGTGLLRLVFPSFRLSGLRHPARRHFT